MGWRENNRDRMRRYMAHQRDVRRAAGLCVRCGLTPAPPGTHCLQCRRVRNAKRQEKVVFGVVPTTSSGASSTVA